MAPRDRTPLKRQMVGRSPCMGRTVHVARHTSPQHGRSAGHGVLPFCGASRHPPFQGRGVGKCVHLRNLFTAAGRILRRLCGVAASGSLERCWLE
eukprot:gene13778-biopygen5052